MSWHYLEWHMRQRLAPLLFVDEDKAEGPVGPAQRSAAGKRKAGTRQTLDGGLPLQSFEDLLEHLAGLTVAELQLEVAPDQRVAVMSAQTPLQQRAFKPPRVKPHPAPAAELLTSGAAET